MDIFECLLTTFPADRAKEFAAARVFAVAWVREEMDVRE
jgi:hypothetical protein